MTEFDAMSHPTFASQILVISVFAGLGAMICTAVHVLLSIEVVPWWAVSVVGAIVGGSVGFLTEWIEANSVGIARSC